MVHRSDMAPRANDPVTLLVLLGLGLCWSLVAPLGRLAGDAGVPVLVFPAVASLGGALTLTLLCAAARSWPSVTAKHIPFYVQAGTFGHAFPQISLFVAVQHVPIGIIGLIIATTPLFTFALALLTGVERFAPLRAAGLALGFGGALLVLVPQSALPDPASLPWVIFAFLTPVSWAISNVFSVRWRPAGSNPRTNALGMLAVSALVLVGAVAVTGQWYLPRLPFGTGDAALLVNGLVAGLAFVLYFTLLDRAGAVVMSFVSFLNLGLATLYGILWFGERPSLWIVAALAAIVAGLVVLQRAK